MTPAAMAAAALAGFAVLAGGDARQVTRSRLRSVSSRQGVRSTRDDRGGSKAWVVLAVAVLPLALHGLGRDAVVAGSAPVLMLLGWRRLSARSTARRDQRAVVSALPRLADLLAACLEAGALPADALDVVRRHIGGPLADRLAPAVGALRSGVDPLIAYDAHRRESRAHVGRGRDDPARGLVAALSRAMDSGAPLADTIAAVADDQRRNRRWSADAAAHRAGVHAIGPLVVCFLPAFVLLGIVPVVFGIADEVLRDLS